MEHLCIGSYVRILTSCAISAYRKFDRFCEKIMLSICEDGATTFSYEAKDGTTVTYSYANFGKIHSSSQNFPTEVVDLAKKKNPRDIEKYFLHNIIPNLEEGRKRNAVAALKNVILKDPEIVKGTQLGTINSMTREDLSCKNDFVLTEFLADIFLYSVIMTDNTKEQGLTKSISKTFSSAYDFMADTINLYEVARSKPIAAIPVTSMGKFDKVFSGISSERLHITASHDLQIYCLKFDDYDFDYQQLWRHLSNNIGLYLYSRVQTQRYLEDDERNLLTTDAINFIKKEIADGRINADNELGEMLLYIFLEQVLKAPKLMSNLEIGNLGGFMSSKSSGIHLLTSNGTTPYSEIVLGTSMIDDDLKIAIDVAFSEAQKLEKRKKEERRFVESRIFASSFPKEIYAQLEAVILPSEAGKAKPTTAFGMFMGYSLAKIPSSGKTPIEYQKDIIAQIKLDIQSHVPYIESKISEYGLDGYSLYIYLLPFKDAAEDKKNFVDKLSNPGGMP